MSKLLILNYHSLFQFETENEDSIYSVHIDEFRKQLELIHKLDYKVVLIDRISQLSAEEKPYVSLTFDDANSSDFLLAAPILSEFGYKATFYLPVNQLTDDFIHKYQVLLDSGNQIGAHGITHTYLTDLNVDRQFSELKQSKKEIESIFKNTSEYFALPGGKYSKTTIYLAKKAGFKGLLTTQFGFVDLKKQHYLLKRYTVKRKTSFKIFNEILLQNKRILLIEMMKSKMKKLLHLFLSNQTIDKLNYKLNK